MGYNAEGSQKNKNLVQVYENCKKSCYLPIKTNIKNIKKGYFFFQAEDGIRDAQESRGLGDVYKRQKKKLYLRLFSSKTRVLKAI